MINLQTEIPHIRLDLLSGICVWIRHHFNHFCRVAASSNKSFQRTGKSCVFFRPLNSTVMRQVPKSPLDQ